MTTQHEEIVLLQSNPMLTLSDFDIPTATTTAIDALDITHLAITAVDEAHTNAFKRRVEALGYRTMHVEPSEIDTEVIRGTLRRDEISNWEWDDGSDIANACMDAWEDINISAIVTAVLDEHLPQLYDANTAEVIGKATPEQAAASYSTFGPSGIILIGADGDVLTDGSWEAQQPGVRKVYAS